MAMIDTAIAVGVNCGRDAGQREAQERVQSVWPADPALRRDLLQVVVDRAVLCEIHAHGRSQPDLEVCGVLAGQLCRDERGPFLHVKAAVRGAAATSKATQVTFTAETWDIVQRLMERQHANDRIVGWYHTHPDFGVFLSDMDMFIHNNFFDLPWQIAWVHDPVRDEHGLFLWRAGRLGREPYILHGPGGAGQTEAQDVQITAPDSSAEYQPGADLSGELSRRLRKAENQLQWTRALLAVVGVVALIWPLWLNYAMRPRQQALTPDPPNTPSPAVPFIPKPHR